MSEIIFTVSSAVQIYLTKRKCAYSYCNTGDVFKRLCYKRTKSMNLKIMNSEKNKHNVIIKNMRKWH